MTKQDKDKYHFYCYTVVLGNEDSHIIPHPLKKDLKGLIQHLEEIVQDLKEVKKKNIKVPREL